MYEAFSVQVQLCKRHYEEWLLKYFFRAPPLLLSKEAGVLSGLKLLVYEALRYKCMRPYATSV